MRRKTKLTLILVALAVVFTAFAVITTAAGEDGMVSYVNISGETSKGTLAEAVSNAQKDSVITLLGDVTVSLTKLNVPRSMTVDLSGYTLRSVESETLFSISNDFVNFKITGVGDIELEGQLVSSTSARTTVSVIGTERTRGIFITHTGTVDNRIVSNVGGTWLFKNIDVVSTAPQVAYDALFDTADNILGSDMTFDTVDLTYTPDPTLDGGQFIVNVVGTGHLAIKNSGFYTYDSGIQCGYANKDGEEIILIENSVLSCKYPVPTMKRTYAIYGYKDNGGDPHGIVNVYDSVLEAGYRTLCYEGLSYKSHVINLYNSTVRNLTPTGDEGSYAISRHAFVNFYDGSKVIAPKAAARAGDGGRLVATLGTRTNIEELTLGNSEANAVVVYDYTTEAGEDVYVPISESKVYAWRYDPITDPEAPYVVVERVLETVEGKFDEEGNPVVIDLTETGPDFSKHFSFETIQTKNADDLLYKEGKKYDGWNSTEKINSAGGIEINFSLGSVIRNYNVESSYLKYAVTASTSDPSAVKRDFLNESAGGNYMILGQYYASGADAYALHGGRVGSDTRKKVIAVHFDFGTDSKVGYPEFSFSPSAGIMGVKDVSSGYSSGITVKSDGTVINGLKDSEEVVLNPINEWNRLSAIFYTDPADSTGTCYFFINGEYIGYTEVYSAKYTSSAYITGIKAEMAKTEQTVGASLCIDNVMYMAYSDYQIDGERDATATLKKDEDGLIGVVYSDDGVKYPEQYASFAPAKKYVRNVIGVSGLPVEDTLENIGKYAETLSTVVDVISDGFAAVKLNTEIHSKGYDFELTSDSHAAVVDIDLSGRARKFVTDSTLNDIEVTYKWYIGEYENAEQMQDVNNEKYYVTTVVRAGHIPYCVANHKSINDVEKLLSMKYIGWNSSGEYGEMEELRPITVSFAITHADKTVYMYPSYEKIPILSHVENERGEVIKVANSELNTVEFYGALSDGETLILHSDLTLSRAFYFFDDSKTEIVNGKKYVGGVLIDGSYTEAEKMALKDAASVLSVDLNGHKIISANGGRVAAVSNNVLFNVYSSKPGAEIAAATYKNSLGNVGGERILAIMNRDGNDNLESSEVFNSYLNVGDYTDAEGNTYSGANLTVNGAVIIEGHSGDSSCVINVGGICAVRSIADSTAAVMTRRFAGKININDALFIMVDKGFIDMRDYPDAPVISVNNCIIVNDGNEICKVSGNSAKKIEFTDCVTNGKMVASGKVTINKGNAASEITVSDESLIPAKYNVPMQLGNDYSADGVLKIRVPYMNEDKSIEMESYAYVADFGMSKNVPSGEQILITLPKIAVKLSGIDDIRYVIFNDYSGSKLSDEIYAKGAEYDIPAIPDHKLSSLITLKFDGTFKIAEDDGLAVTYVPDGYTAVANPTGIAANMTLYTSFDINLYIPDELKSLLVGVYVGDESVQLKEKSIAGRSRTFAGATISPEDFTEEITFILCFEEEIDGKVYSANASVTLSAFDYFARALGESIDDKEMGALIWYAVDYANKAYKLVNGEYCDAASDLLKEYIILSEGLDLPDIESMRDAALATVFVKVNVRLKNNPAFVFTVRGGFEGKITVKYGSVMKEYDITEGSDREIVLDGMPISEFVGNIEISAEGSVSGEAVSIQGSKYNLSAYRDYHISNSKLNNGLHSEKSKEALELIEATYLYARVASNYLDSLAD